MVCLTGCIDKAYDLNNLEAGEVTIGNDESVFTIPLATITMSAHQMKSDSADAQSIFEEVDIWMPTTLPGGVDYVEIERMKTDRPYIDRMIDALFAEMMVREQKMNDVVNLIWSSEEYMNFFRNSPQITALGIPTDNEVGFKTAFKTHFGDDGPVGEALRDATRGRAEFFMPSIHIDKVRFDAPIDMDGMIVDMLSESGNVSIYGVIRSEFPISFLIAPEFEGTGTTTEAFMIEPNQESEFPETTFDGEGLRHLLTDFAVDVAFTPENYFPAIGVQEDQTIRIELFVRKTGGMTIELGGDDNE